MKKTVSAVLALVFLALSLFSCGQTPVPEDPAGPETAPPAEEEQTVVTLYVSPDGDDGAEGTIEAPLATLDGARLRVRDLLAETERPIVVCFRGGDYYMTEGVVFEEEDSGKDDAPITYKAYEGESVRFIGGRKVDPSKITRADDRFLSRLKSEEAKSVLLQADVSEYTDVFPDLYAAGHEKDDAVMQMELYLGDTAVIPARWPNRGGAYDFNYVVSADRDVEINGDDYTFFYGDEIAEKLETWSEESLRDLYIYGFMFVTWDASRHAIESVDKLEQSMTVHGFTNPWSYPLSRSCRLFFDNVPEELDVPGESYVDREKRIVYFYPTEDFDPEEVYLSTLTDDMITLDRASHLRFVGIDLLYTRGNGVWVDRASDVVFFGCQIGHTSSKAAFLYQSDHITIDSCRLFDLANGGIVFIGGDPVTLSPVDSAIRNCEIADVNRDGNMWSPAVMERMYPEYIEQSPGIIAAGLGLVISHNRIHGSAHKMIAVEANDVLIEYNEFYDCVRESNDMGVIYWADISILGTVIRYNYFHDNGNVYNGVGQQCIYLDTGSMGCEAYGNLFVRATGIDDQHVSSCVLLNGAQYFHFYNNVVVDTVCGVYFNSFSGGTGSRQSDWIRLLFERFPGYGTRVFNLFIKGFDSGIWRQHYEGTLSGNLLSFTSRELYEKYRYADEKDLLSYARTVAPWKTNEFDNNVFVSVKEVSRQDPCDMHDNLITEDHGLFADSQHDDYTLTEEGLATVLASCPDFEPLPLEKIGPQKDAEEPDLVSTIEIRPNGRDGETRVAALDGSAGIGDVVRFGLYEQDGSEDNGPEEIEWIVLDRQDGKLLLISRYVLESMEFYPVRAGITWADSTIRTWLNGTFFDTALTVEEQNRVSPVRLTGGAEDPGDFVFLLNEEEAARYFETDEGRTCQPTEAERRRGLFLSGNYCCWWLRSNNGNRGLAVLPSGYVWKWFDFPDYNIGIRPCLWIDLMN